MVYSAVLAACSTDGRSWVQALNLYQCLWTHLQVCGSKRLGCHADILTVSRCHTRGEFEGHRSEKACKWLHPSFGTQGRRLQVSHQRVTQVRKHASGSTLALKPRANVIRSPKQGYQWPHEKESCAPIFF